MSEFLSKFGKNLREYRKLSGFDSQEKFAEAVGVSTNTIAAVENGKSFFKMDNYEKVCAVLNITPNVLFDFCEKETNLRNKYESIIMTKIQKLTTAQQKQLLDIIDTFKKD